MITTLQSNQEPQIFEDTIQQILVDLQQLLDYIAPEIERKTQIDQKILNTLDVYNDQIKQR